MIINQIITQVSNPKATNDRNIYNQKNHFGVKNIPFILSKEHKNQQVPFSIMQGSIVIDKHNVT